MVKRLHIRLLSLCLMLVIALAASAQRPQITDRLNQSGQVTVDAPKELVKRNNADLGKQQQQATNKDKKVKEKDKKKTDPKSEDEKLNELDDENDSAKKDEEKKKEEEKKKKEEVTPKKPKLKHTSQ